MMALHPVYRDRLRPVLWLLGALALVLVASAAAAVLAVLVALVIMAGCP